MDDPETVRSHIVSECEPAQVGSFGADRVQVGVFVRATSRAAIAQAQPVAWRTDSRAPRSRDGARPAAGSSSSGIYVDGSVGVTDVGAAPSMNDL